MIPKPFARVDVAYGDADVRRARITARARQSEAPRFESAARAAVQQADVAARASSRSLVRRAAARSRGARCARAARGIVSRCRRGPRRCCTTRGCSRQHAAPIPVMSVGNLTVGGTGKTPIAAWIACASLRRAGRAPAIVMRGYGGDEPLVHARLNPEHARLIAARIVSRQCATRSKRAADVAVLDDAFQHRRARRDRGHRARERRTLDAEHALLPAGPLREPLVALCTRIAASSSREKRRQTERVRP